MTIEELKNEARARATERLLGLALALETSPNDPIMQKIVCKNLIVYADEYKAKLETAEVLAQTQQVLNDPISAR